MITKEQLENLVKQYVSTQALDLAAFSQKFAEMFYDIEETGELDAIQFSYQIEAVLARMTAGLCSESELKDAMKALLPALSLTVLDATPAEDVQQQVGPYFFANLVVVGAGTGKLLVFAGISPSVGFGSAVVLPSTHRTSTDLPPLQQLTQAI